MARGGKREGAGRRKGTTNQRIKRLRSVMRDVASVIERDVPDAFEGDGHALMVAIYKDPKFPVELRLDAAKAAARYEKPVLAAVEHMGRGGGPIEISDGRDRLAHLIAREAAAQEQGPDTPTTH